MARPLLCGTPMHALPRGLVLALAIGCGESAVVATDGGADSSVAEADGATGECDRPLGEEVLSKLTTGIEANVAMQPGDERTFELGVVECCYSFEPVNACAEWSVTASEGADPAHATIDVDSGRLTIDGGAQGGDVFVVSTDIEDGRRAVHTEVYIYTPGENPLFGTWREDVQFSCGSGDEREPESAIKELRFRADRSILVTWYPFELYVDYWGSYGYDLESGSFSFDVQGGNYIPDDIDPSGRFAVDAQDRLILDDIWLGTPPDGEAAPKCGHRFVR